MNRNIKKILTFIVLVFLLSSYFYYKIIASGSLFGNGMAVFGIMWMPALAAVITKLIFDKDLKGLGFRLGKIRYLLISYLLPIMACLVVYSLVWLVGLGGFSPEKVGIVDVSTLFNSFLRLSTVGILSSAITATGEEIGWRGFLVPHLYKEFSFTKTALISGVIWNIYHYPILLFAGYNNGVSVVSSFIFFTISVFAVCFIATWLRIKSGSVWPAVILHASHNLFVQNVFDRITVDYGQTKFFTTEFGLGLALIYVIIAYYFWRKRAALNKVY